MGFYGPPHPHLILTAMSKREEGGAAAVKEEESDGAAVVYEVTRDSVHRCQSSSKTGQ